MVCELHLNETAIKKKRKTTTNPSGFLYDLSPFHSVVRQGNCFLPQGLCTCGSLLELSSLRYLHAWLPHFLLVSI